MTLNEILALQDDSSRINELRQGRTFVSLTKESVLEELDPYEHSVFDKVKRPKKLVKVDREGSNINKISGSESDLLPQEVARIGLALQKLIIRRAASFIFGNPVEITTQLEENNEIDITFFDTIKDILKMNRINSINRSVAKNLFACKEVAELWYPQTSNDPVYAMKSKYKLRVRVLSPLLGDSIYPYFDETGDLIAFSREYSVQYGETTKKFFETYTKDQIFKWDISDGISTVVESDNSTYPRENPIGKIPVVYACQEHTEYRDVHGLIERLETLLSNFADTNDYHGSPKIFINGTVTGFAKKGENGAILQGDKDAKAQYLSWDHAPESVKLEINTLLNLMYTISQTPDISFENVKGLGSSVSGKALKMMFLDAHLKVEDHMEVLGEYLDRRISVIDAYVKSFDNTKFGKVNLSIESKVTPYMIDDESEKISTLMIATGNKAILSQKTAIGMTGLVADANAEYEQILKEGEVATVQNVFGAAK